MIHGVICYWKLESFLGKKTKWVLVESHAIDADGYLLSEASTGGGRHEYEGWVTDDMQKIPGRALTFWNFGMGVQLWRFNPLEPVDWISPYAEKKLIKGKRWIKVLSGNDFYFGTINEVMDKFVTFKEK